jgi:hypothetical protein
MKFSAVFLFAFPLAALAADNAADPAAQAVAAIRELGAVNGQALACGVGDIQARAKAMMLRHSPRTAAYGSAFQEATNAAFNEQTRRPAEQCPDAAALGRRLDALAGRLDAVLPTADGVAK